MLPDTCCKSFSLIHFQVNGCDNWSQLSVVSLPRDVGTLRNIPKELLKLFLFPCLLHPNMDCLFSLSVGGKKTCIYLFICPSWWALGAGVLFLLSGLLSTSSLAGGTSPPLPPLPPPPLLFLHRLGHSLPPRLLQILGVSGAVPAPPTLPTGERRAPLPGLKLFRFPRRRFG